MRILRASGVSAAMAGLALMGALPTGTKAQVSAADSAAVLFETARTFEARDRWEVAEALYRLVVERYGSTPAAEAARERLDAAEARQASGDGTVETQVWMALYGAWLGIALPTAFGSDSPEAYGVGLVVGGPSGFLAGRSLARSLGLSAGQARAVTLGGTWGTWQGFGWQEVFDLGVQQRCDPQLCYDAEDSVEEAFAAMIVGGLAGIASGALLARRDITPGVGTTVNFSALWGTWFGFAGGVLADQEGDDLLAATLVGGNAGLLATALLAPGWNVSRNRARLVSIAGVLGGLAGAGMDLILQPESDKVLVGIPLAGSVAGLLIGVRATGDSDNGGAASASRPGFGAPWGAGREAQAAPSRPVTSLLALQRGRLTLGTPAPVPTWVWAHGPRRTRGGPAFAFEIFRASF